MNIVADIITGVTNIAGNIVEFIATTIYHFTGFPDPKLLITFSAAFIVVPIVYFFIEFFTETTSSFKLTFMILLLIFVFVDSEYTEYTTLMLDSNMHAIRHTHTIEELIAEAAHEKGEVAFRVSMVFSIFSIMIDPYYQGLFGRFKNQ